MPQATLQKPHKRLWFHHGDLLFFTGLVRGNFTKDFPELKHDGGLWVSVEKCLDVFNKARKRHWGVRQVIQMVAEDRKGRMEMMGIDIQRKEAVNQAYFPVIIRATQGHNASIAKNPDTDISIASAYYSILDKSEADSAATREGVPVVCLEDVPKILYHRTSRDSFQSILQGGLIAGSQSSGRVHNYFATCPVSLESYRSVVRAYAPIEIKWDTEKLLRSGCLLFATRSEGVLCREPCAFSAIISITDAVKEELLYSLRIDDASEVPSGSAGSTLPTRKRQLLARESLSSTDAPMAEPDDEYVEVEVEQEETMDATEGEVPQPRTPLATRMTVEDAAANVPEPENPFVMTHGAIHLSVSYVPGGVFCGGQRHCIRCRRRLAESKGDRRFIQAAHRRNRILDRLATGSTTSVPMSCKSWRGTRRRKNADRWVMRLILFARPRTEYSGHSRSRARTSEVW